MEAFKITDLLPRRASFKLMIPDKVYNLRPCTPRDLIKLKDMGIEVEEVMRNPISADVCKVILYLMEYSDAKEFKIIELKTINIETGEEETENIGGYKLLLKFIASLKEQLEMFIALLKSMGFKEKIIEDIKVQTFGHEFKEEDIIVSKKKKTKRRVKKKS